MLEIFPDKFTPVSQTIVGQAMVLLSPLAQGHDTVSGLYAKARERSPAIRFDDFAMALTFLYAAGIVHYEDGFLKLERA